MIKTNTEFRKLPYFQSPQLEYEYHLSTFQNTLPLVRFAILVSVIVHTTFPTLDYIVLNPDHETAWILRVGILLPLSVLGLALSYQRNFFNFHQWLIGFVITINAGAWIYASIVYDADTVLYWTIGIIEIALFA